MKRALERWCGKRSRDRRGIEGIASRVGRGRDVSKGRKGVEEYVRGCTKALGSDVDSGSKRGYQHLRVRSLYVSELNLKTLRSRVISNLSRRSLRLSLPLPSRPYVVYRCLSLHLIWV